MGNTPEVVREVGVNDFRMAVEQLLIHLRHRLLGVSPRVEKKLQIEGKIRAMKAMSEALDQLIADCANETQPVNECTIIAALERAAVSTPVQ